MKITQRISSLLICAALGAAVTHTPSTRAMGVGEGVAVGAFLHSLWTHYKALPQDVKERPNEYDVKELKKALKDFACGKDTKKNAKKIWQNIKGLYVDGLCGHGSYVSSSPRFNDKKGYTEVNYIDSRGVYGWASDQVNPLLKAADWGKNVIGYAITLAVARQMYERGLAAVGQDFYTAITTGHLGNHKAVAAGK